MRALVILALSAVFLAGFSRPVAAVTPEDIVTLTKSGVSDDVILALVARDRTIFTLNPDDLVVLKRQGLSEAVLVAMLKSGREEGEAAFAEQTSRADADRVETAWLPPNVVVVGHGPDRPNSGHFDRVYAEPFFGYSSYYPSYPAVRRPLCIAQVKPGPTQAGFAYTTGCPLQVHQRSRGKLPR
jgi:hypothetical protein